MKNVKAVLGMVSAGVLGVSLYAGSAQAGDVCDGFTVGWENVGQSISCNLGNGWSASGTSLSGYSNPGVKAVIVNLTSEAITGDRTAYARGEGYAGTSPIGTCITVEDKYVDGQTTTVEAPNGNCSAMTRHRLVIGWRNNPPR